MESTMNKEEKLDLKGYTYLCFLFFLDGYFFLMPKIPWDHNSWLIIIISAFLACIILLIFGHFTADRTLAAWWKVLLSMPAFFFGLYSLLAFCRFVKECSMWDTPSWILPLMLLIIAFFAAKKSLIIVARIGRTLSVVSIVVLIISFLFLLPEINMEYVTAIVKPFNQSWILQTIVHTGVFTLKGLILLSIQKSTQSAKGFFTKNICTGAALMVSSMIIGALFLVTLLVLGNGLFSVLLYPIYYPLGLTHMGQYFERAEIIGLILFMTLEFFKLTIIMSYFQETILKLKLKIHPSISFTGNQGNTKQIKESLIQQKPSKSHQS